MRQLCKRAGEKLKKRFTLAVLTTEYSNRIQHIRRINEDLDTLVNGAQRCAATASVSTSDLSVIANYYKRVRDGAQSIYNVLKKGFQAPHSCDNREHGVSLCLEVRNAGTKQKQWSHSSVDTVVSLSSLRFNVLLCLAEVSLEELTLRPIPPTWKELEVEQHNSNNVDAQQQRPVPFICAEDLDDNHTCGLAQTPSSPVSEGVDQTVISGQHGLHNAKTPHQRPVTPKDRVGFIDKAST